MSFVGGVFEDNVIFFILVFVEWDEDDVVVVDLDFFFEFVVDEIEMFDIVEVLL